MSIYLFDNDFYMQLKFSDMKNDKKRFTGII